MAVGRRLAKELTKEAATSPHLAPDPGNLRLAVTSGSESGASLPRRIVRRRFFRYTVSMTGVAAVANIVYRNSLSLIISSHLEILGTISTQLTAETTLVWSGGGRTGSGCWLGSCDFFRCPRH